MKSFEEKTVFVTGGAQGIGLCIVKRFCEEGASVFFCDIDPEAGKEAESSLKKDGFNVSFINADVGIISDVNKTISEIKSKTKSLNVLINNAGIGDRKSLLERTVEEWDRIINVNLRAGYLFTSGLLEIMPEYSSIINISSTRALQSEPNTEPYSASKAGLLGLTHSLAISLAPKNIRVNCILPGWIETIEWQKSSKKGIPKHSKEDNLQHPAGRVGIPDDVAYLCLFLADSKKAGFITGQNFVVDGGMTKKMIYV